MKILLIYPYFLEERIEDEDIHPVPMGLYSVATVLKKEGYDVEILDWHQINRKPEKIQEELLEKRPQIIGFSILHGNRWGGIEIARIAKSLVPEVKVVFGGIGATFLWEHLLRHFQEIDAIVLGEGEYTFLSYVRQMEGKQSKDPGEIRGMAFRKDGRPVRTEPGKPVQDLDLLPIPAKYFTYQHLSSTRGCAWDCSFCGSPQFWGRKVRFRSPGHFLRELELLYKKGVSFFYFSDDSFTLNKKRAMEICRGIIERDLRITWYAISRVETVDEEILSWMRRAGCIQISYGIESGSQKIRESFHKHISREQILQAFTLAKRVGILPRAYFIYGSPEETRETIQESIDLMNDIQPLGAVFYILDIFPGTELYADLLNKGSITDDIWLKRMEGIMYCETDPALSDDLILSFGSKLRKTFHERVHAFADAVDLIDDEEFYKYHADFCSRLGLTFSHGDYSRAEAVKNKEVTAERLFKKALSYHPDHRAFLGLGIINQRRGEWHDSIRILSEGLDVFPESLELLHCLGISLLNVKDYSRALSCFLKLPATEKVKPYIAECREGLRS